MTIGKITVSVPQLLIVALAWSSHPATAASDYDRFLQEQKGEFNQFVTTVNSQFAAHLQQQWQEFQAFQGKPLYTQPKLTTPPERDEPPMPPLTTTPDLNEAELRRLLGPYYNRLEGEGTTQPTPVPPQAVAPNAPLYFFGKTLHLNTAELRQALPPRPALNNRALSQYWQQMAQSPYPPIVTALQQQATTLQLNDWGSYQLTRILAASLSSDPIQQRLVSWFLLNQLGYQVKVGYNRQSLHLLARVSDEVYGMTYYQLEGGRFYNLTQKEDRSGGEQVLQIYSGLLTPSQRPLTIALKKIPQIGQQPVARLLKFNYGGQAYSVPIVYNATLVHYFESYPQVGMSVLFQAPIDGEAQRSLLTRLSEIIAGQSEVDAVNILLRFVQTAFTYLRDEDQFGGERYLFAQQTLGYPGSDCEDRVVLFRYLVTQLLGLEVVGIRYEGHMAAAVRFKQPLDGDGISYRGHRFIICDPTYINANAGESMPKYRGRIEEVLPSAG